MRTHGGLIYFVDCLFFSICCFYHLRSVWAGHAEHLGIGVYTLGFRRFMADTWAFWVEFFSLAFWFVP